MEKYHVSSIRVELSVFFFQTRIQNYALANRGFYVSFCLCLRHKNDKLYVISQFVFVIA